MKTLIVGLFLLVSTLSASAQELSKDLTAVSYVDLTKYQGAWYEIARLPVSFEKKCAGYVRAEYKILPNKEVQVLNSCLLENGDKNIAEGRARVADKTSSAKLDVTFVKALGQWVFLFSGDYWIIDLDKNYQWAVVGEPKRKYGWILSRTPSLDNSVLFKISESLQERGYNPCDFQTTKQFGGIDKIESLCKLILPEE